MVNFIECNRCVFTHVQMLQEEKELKDVKTAVSGLVEVFKVKHLVIIFKWWQLNPIGIKSLFSAFCKSIRFQVVTKRHLSLPLFTPWCKLNPKITRKCCKQCDELESFRRGCD